MLRYVMIDYGGGAPGIPGGLFEDPAKKDQYEDDLLLLLEHITQWNQRYLKRNPGTPHLYDLIERGEVVYKVPEQVDSTGDAVGFFPGGEHFRTIPAIIENGGGDCDNLVTFRTAELRNAGYKVKPYLTSREREGGGGRIYHALVWWPHPRPRGSTEDPSLIAGMGGAAKATEREAELEKNRERVEMRDKKIRAGIVLGYFRPPFLQGSLW